MSRTILAISFVFVSLVTLAPETASAYYAPNLGRFVSRDPETQRTDRPLAGDGYQDGLNLYEYVAGRPTAAVDPNGLYATPGYGHFCGPRNGAEWDGVSKLDCLDQACKWHDDCIGHPGAFMPPFKITYCDQLLSAKAYYCAAIGCDTAACRAAAAVIGAWMALPGCGTVPVGPFYK